MSCHKRSSLLPCYVHGFVFCNNTAWQWPSEICGGGWRTPLMIVSDCASIGAQRVRAAYTSAVCCMLELTKAASSQWQATGRVNQLLNSVIVGSTPVVSAIFSAQPLLLASAVQRHAILWRCERVHGQLLLFQQTQAWLALCTKRC